jgi:hypothetical protein
MGKLYEAFVRRDAIAAQDHMVVFIAEAEKSFFLKHQDKASAPSSTKVPTVKRKGVKHV